MRLAVKIDSPPDPNHLCYGSAAVAEKLCETVAGSCVLHFTRGALLADKCDGLKGKRALLGLSGG